jgi:SM-20-related protein
MPTAFYREPASLNTPLVTRGPIDGDVFARITEALREHGYIILGNVFSAQELQSLLIDIKKTDSQYFHSAGIGREQKHHVNHFVRRDRIRWLDSGHEPVLFYLDWAERLRRYLNRELFLGLFDYECHYSHYPKGAFYKRHRDTFKGNTNRRLSTILYLNPSWQAGDGGELVIYDPAGQAVLETVLPAFGSMVFFLSEEFPHEVLPTRCSRYSLTGWFRINTPGIF